MEHPETLGTHYGLLVPNIVSFDQFWSRYYYRCSLTTVLAAHNLQEESNQENAKNTYDVNSKKAQQSLRREIEDGLNVNKAKIHGSGKKKKKKTNNSNLNSSGFGEFFDDDIVETIAEEEDEIAFAASG